MIRVTRGPKVAARGKGERGRRALPTDMPCADFQSVSPKTRSEKRGRKALRGMPLL